MKREPKLTIKFVLVHGEPASNHEAFPVYVQISYKRKTTRFLAYYPVPTDDEGIKNPEGSYKKAYIFEEKLLRKIIAYEVKKQGQNFSITGLVTKHKIYMASLQNSLEKYLKSKIFQAIRSTANELGLIISYESPFATVHRVLKACYLLFPDFDKYLNETVREELIAYDLYHKLNPPDKMDYEFPTIIDWLDGSYLQQLKEDFAKAEFKNGSSLESLIELINTASERTIKSRG